MTASLNGLASAAVVVTVSAAALDPAVANDFTLSGNRELTIEAGQMESTGTGTVTAVNNGVDAPSKTVEVTASVTGGNGVSPESDSKRRTHHRTCSPAPYHTPASARPIETLRTRAGIPPQFRLPHRSLPV